MTSGFGAHAWEISAGQAAISRMCTAAGLLAHAPMDDSDKSRSVNLRPGPVLLSCLVVPSFSLSLFFHAFLWCVLNYNVDGRHRRDELRELQEGVKWQMSFCTKFARLRLRGAGSMPSRLHSPTLGVFLVCGGECAHDLRSKFGKFLRNGARWLTNCDALLPVLSRRCPGDHEHDPVEVSDVE